MLIRSGLTPSHAGVAAGVSEATGRRLFDNAGGVKPALHQPHNADIRPRLTLSERITIQVGVQRGESLRSISARLGRAPSTIKRELDNNVRNRYDGRKSGLPAQGGVRCPPIRQHRRGALRRARPPTNRPTDAPDAPHRAS
nr:helix-turn-helix domain-containing protein [Mycolicibacter arupensis]